MRWTSSSRGWNHSAALVEYERALKLDDQHAELLFRIARCQLVLSRFDEARKCFERARDLDTLRFRSDSEVNRLIASASVGRVMVDAAALISTNSAHQIAGEELLYEHVHFNFAGNYLLARAYAAQVLGSGAKPDGLLSAGECARRLAFTDFNRYKVLDEVRERLRQPPFSTQSNHEERDARLKRELDKLDRASFSDAVYVYEQALARSPEDAVLHENFATLLQDFGREPEAQKHWRRVIELLPHNEQGWFGLANLLDSEGRSTDAIPLFREAIRRDRWRLKRAVASRWPSRMRVARRKRSPNMSGSFASRPASWRRGSTTASRWRGRGSTAMQRLNIWRSSGSSRTTFRRA